LVKRVPDVRFERGKVSQTRILIQISVQVLEIIQTSGVGKRVRGGFHTDDEHFGQDWAE
jgi:hypothetical protein